MSKQTVYLDLFMQYELTMTMNLKDQYLDDTLFEDPPPVDNTEAIPLTDYTYITSIPVLKEQNIVE